MIYNKKGEIFVHRLINVCIGDYVLANEKSDYSGLVGVVREIRTDEDKETENESADIYVDFLKPKNPEVLFEIEERFNDLSGEEKEFEEDEISSRINKNTYQQHGCRCYSWLREEA